MDLPFCCLYIYIYIHFETSPTLFFSRVLRTTFPVPQGVVNDMLPPVSYETALGRCGPGWVLSTPLIFVFVSVSFFFFIYIYIYIYSVSNGQHGCIIVWFFEGTHLGVTSKGSPRETTRFFFWGGGGAVLVAPVCSGDNLTAKGMTLGLLARRPLRTRGCSPKIPRKGPQ